MNSLKKYKLDKAFTEGVTMYLDDAPDVAFLVKLPSAYNRAYSQALYGSLDWSMEEGQVKTGGGLMATHYLQQDAFIEHCLISADGEPIPADFAAEYPTALAELMEKANELAAEITEKVETSAKKLSVSSSGSENGQDGNSSMPDLKTKAG